VENAKARKRWDCGGLRRAVAENPGAAAAIGQRNVQRAGTANGIAIGNAQKLWIAFHDHIEQRLGVGRELDPVRGLANKLPEHAARIAAVLTLVNDIAASEVGTDEMQASIELTQHYAAEAMRLFSAGRVSTDLREAEQLRVWLLTVWSESHISLPDIYQRGPSAIRDKARAHRAVTVLGDHGWLGHAAPCEVDGTFRREVWRIVKE
jgi:hypothetical protein